MSEEIKLVDFRNACYQGYLQNGSFHKIGAVLTQDFMFCLAAWNNGRIEGPCFILFPNEQIFYGQFQLGYPHGLCCYEMGNQCQIFCTFIRGVLNSHIVATFPRIEHILDLEINQNQQLKYMQQYIYKGQQQKWIQVQKLLRMNVPLHLRKFNKFIQHHFLPFYPQLQQAFGQEYFVGFKGEGLGIKISLQDLSVKSVGFYNQTNLLKLMGKKIISKEKRVREEGIYNRPETLIRYQVRPDRVRKHYRDLFRVSINFQNRFLLLPILQGIESDFNKLKIQIKDNTTHKIAQQLIEHLDQPDTSQGPVRDRSASRNSRGKSYQRKNTNNRSNTSGIKCENCDKSQSKMMDEVSFQKVRDQLDRSMSQKKKSESSPYKTYSMTPAQLKYTSKTKPSPQPPIPYTSPFPSLQTPQRTSYHPSYHPSNHPSPTKIPSHIPKTTSKLPYRYCDQEDNPQGSRGYSPRRKILKQNTEEMSYPMENREVRYPMEYKNNSPGKHPRTISQLAPNLDSSYYPPNPYSKQQNNSPLSPSKPHPYLMSATKQGNYQQNYGRAREKEQGGYKGEGEYKGERGERGRRGGDSAREKLEELSVMYQEILDQRRKSPNKARMNGGKGYKFREDEEIRERMGLEKMGDSRRSPRSPQKAGSPQKLQNSFNNRTADQNRRNKQYSYYDS